MNAKLYQEILKTCNTQKGFFLPLLSKKGFALPQPNKHLLDHLNMIKDVQTSSEIISLQRSIFSPTMEQKISSLSVKQQSEVISWLHHKDFQRGFFGQDYKNTISYQDQIFSNHGIYSQNPNVNFFVTMPITHNLLTQNQNYWLTLQERLSKHFVIMNKGIPHGYLSYYIPCSNCCNSGMLCFLCNKNIYSVGILNHNKLPPYPMDQISYGADSCIRSRPLPLCTTDVHNKLLPQGISILKNNLLWHPKAINQAFLPVNYQHLPKQGLSNLIKPWDAKPIDELLPSFPESTAIITHE